MEPFQFEDRLVAIETRLAKIESHFKMATPPPVMPTAVPEVLDPWNDPVPKAGGVQKVEKPGNWLGVIAVVCFVLAAAFIIKLSIDSGWLTPVRQVCLAALLGLSLVGSGFGLMRSDREYASLLPGAGVTVLFLTAFAAHRYYDLISFEQALGLTALVSSLCVWLYTKIKHDIYPITAALGAYISPVILELHADGIFSLYYFLICSVAFTTIAAWLESRVLLLISAYLAVVVTAFVGLDLHQNILIAGILGIHFLVFSGGNYLFSQHTGKPLDKDEAWYFLPVLLIFYAVEYYYLYGVNPQLAPWISLGFAGILLCLYALAKMRFPDGAGGQSLILAFVSVACFHSVYLELMPEIVRPWLLVAILLGGCLLPMQWLSGKATQALVFPAFALTAIVVIEYLSISYHLARDYTPDWCLVSFAALASIWIARVRFDAVLLPDGELSHALLGTAHVLAILALYRLTNDVGSLAVSASWLFYAVAVIVYAFIRKDDAMLKSALFVLGFAAAKALLYDAASAATIVRIFCLLLTGVVLYGCGFFMRQSAHWKKD